MPTRSLDDVALYREGLSAVAFERRNGRSFFAFGVRAMRLKSLTLDNFRCFERLELVFPSRDEYSENAPLDDAPSKMIDAGTTVLVARNGEGKTAVLDAVAYLLGVALSHFPDVPSPEVKETDIRLAWIKEPSLFPSEWTPSSKPPYMRIAATAVDGNDKFGWDVTLERDDSPTTQAEIPEGRGNKEIFAWSDGVIDRINAHKAPDKFFPVFAYYKTSRALVRKPERRRNFRKAFDRYDGYRGALKGRLDYKKTFEWIDYLEDKRRRAWEELRNFDYDLLEYKTLQLAIEKTLPGFKNLRTIASPLDLIVDYEDDAQFKTCRLESQLSDGYKIVLTLVLDLVSRALELNSDLPSMTPERILAVPGIVLIDEIDLHLHPSWQQRVMIDLQNAFPNVQFVVSTHSPQVVSSLPKEVIRVLEYGEIIPVDGQTRGVESQQILSRIFGASPTPSDDFFVRALERYASLEAEGQADSPEGRATYKLLAEHFGTDYPPLQHIEIHRIFVSGNGENYAQI